MRPKKPHNQKATFPGCFFHAYRQAFIHEFRRRMNSSRECISDKCYLRRCDNLLESDARIDKFSHFGLLEKPAERRGLKSVAGCLPSVGGEVLKQSAAGYAGFDIQLETLIEGRDSVVECISGSRKVKCQTLGYLSAILGEYIEFDVEFISYVFAVGCGGLQCNSCLASS